jgi:hypothetical protein
MKEPTTMKIRFILSALAIAAVAQAHAYTTIGLKLPPGPVRFDINLDTTFDFAAMSALAAWDQYTGATHLVGRPVSSHNFGLHDGRDEIFWSTDLNLNLDPSVLGVCSISSSNGRTITETDIIMNHAEFWGSYSGPLQSSLGFDINRVLLHEVGHAIGLGHSQDAQAIMSPFINNTWQLTADDIAGATAIYGPTAMPDTGTTFTLLALGIISLAGLKDLIRAHVPAGRL